MRYWIARARRALIRAFSNSLSIPVMAFSAAALTTVFLDSDSKNLFLTGYTCGLASCAVHTAARVWMRTRGGNLDG